MNLVRRRFFSLAGAAVAAPAISSVAWSQTYPERSIRIIVPLAPGGGTDYVARATGKFVSQSLGQQVVVENKTGAGGTVGIEAAAKSPPDGYTLLVSNDNIASAPQIQKVNSDYQKDLVPVVLLTRQPMVWAVHQSLNVNTLAEWFGLFVPAGTPPAIVARLNAEFGKALAVPAIREDMLKSANEPVGGSAEQFARLVRDDSEKYARLSQELGIKVN